MKIKALYFKDVGPLGDQCIDLVNDWDDSIEPRSLLSGPNGCGKSTVLRTVAMLWDALGYWLDQRKALPKAHLAREWLQRWGGCAVVLTDVPSEGQVVGLIFGELTWCTSMRSEHVDVQWIGEGVARTGKPGNPKREVFIPAEPWVEQWSDAHKKNDFVVRQGRCAQCRISGCGRAALGVSKTQRRRAYCRVARQTLVAQVPGKRRLERPVGSFPHYAQNHAIAQIP